MWLQLSAKWTSLLTNWVICSILFPARGACVHNMLNVYEFDLFFVSIFCTVLGCVSNQGYKDNFYAGWLFYLNNRICKKLLHWRTNLVIFVLWSLDIVLIWLISEYWTVYIIPSKLEKCLKLNYLSSQIGTIEKKIYIIK